MGFFFKLWYTGEGSHYYKGHKSTPGTATHTHHHHITPYTFSLNSTTTHYHLNVTTNILINTFTTTWHHTPTPTPLITVFTTTTTARRSTPQTLHHNISSPVRIRRVCKTGEVYDGQGVRRKTRKQSPIKEVQSWKGYWQMKFRSSLGAVSRGLFFNHYCFLFILRPCTVSSAVKKKKK